jgi:hypothetical protein
VTVSWQRRDGWWVARSEANGLRLEVRVPSRAELQARLLHDDGRCALDIYDPNTGISYGTAVAILPAS